MTSRHREWQGQITVRILPKGLDGHYVAGSKPLAQRIDPKLLQSDSNIGTPNGSYRIDPQLLAQSQWTFLDVELKSSGKESFRIHLNRDSNEEVSRTLQRLQTSVNKKTKPTTRGNRQKAKKAFQKSEKGAIVSPAASLWKKIDCTGDDSSQTDFEESKEEWNAALSMSNRDIWSQVAASPSISTFVRFSVGDAVATIPVVSCPPTIVGVQTYEDFTARVFAHVPLVVRVDLLFATHAIVDWYLDGSLVCRDSPCYIPTGIGQEVAVVITPIRNGASDGQPVVGSSEAYRFARRVERTPMNRILQLRPEWTRPRQQETSKLRVLTYNVLADQNAFSGDDRAPYYPYVAFEVLERSRRFPLILQEILAYQADIVNLQEVDELVFDSLFKPVMEQYGYQGFYSIKTGSGTREGCAMFWSLKRFQPANAEDMRCYPLRDLVLMEPNEDEKDWESVATISNLLRHQRPDLRAIIDTRLGHIVQMANLKLKETQVSGDVPPMVLVANTHLFYHPQASHIRLMQSFSICRQLIRERSRDCPIVLTGDFNTSLKNSAGRLLVEGSVPKNFRDLKSDLNLYKWGKEVQEESNANKADWPDFPHISLPKGFPALVSGYPEAPEFTHYIAGFKGTLDHILVSQCCGEEHSHYGFAPVASAPMPSETDVTQQVAMPSEFLPSDHVGLVCDLQFKKHTE